MGLRHGRKGAIKKTGPALKKVHGYTVPVLLWVMCCGTGMKVEPPPAGKKLITPIGHWVVRNEAGRVGVNGLMKQTGNFKELSCMPCIACMVIICVIGLRLSFL